MQLYSRNIVFANTQGIHVLYGGAVRKVSAPLDGFYPTGPIFDRPADFSSAVAQIFGLKLSGLIAWVIWATVHLMYLVQFQSRVVVAIHWAFQDLTFSRGARLITVSPISDFDFHQEVASGDEKGCGEKTRTHANTSAAAAQSNA